MPTYVSAGKLFVCPSHKTDVWNGAAPTTNLVAVSGDSNHRGDGANALFIDGHVEWVVSNNITTKIPNYYGATLTGLVTTSGVSTATIVANTTGELRNPACTQ